MLDDILEYFQLTDLSAGDIIWYAVGFFGQFLFFLRWVVQWLMSERRRRSVIPLVFWYFSVVGGLTSLVYAVYIQDPVITLANLFNSIVYIRNLILIYREKTETRAAADDAAPAAR